MALNSYAAKDGKLFMEVKRLKEGNTDAYQNVYELSKNYIYKIINDIVQNHHTTEDLMQETYLQIYRKIDTLNEPTAFYVWAGRIATNLTLRHVQKYRNEVAFAQVAEDEDSGTIFDKAQNDYEEFIPETVLHNAEQQKIIAEILDGLSVEQKLSVQYYYFEEMSVNDIAEEMQCSPGTVKSRLNYARKSLKDAISQFEIKNDVKLYSLASIPVFYFVFRNAAEGLFTGAVMGAGAVATAGGAAGNIAGSTAAGTSAGSGTVAGTATGSGVSTLGGMATNNSLVSTGAVVGKATAGVAGNGTVTGTAATTVTTAAGAAAVTAKSGFLATIAGKVVVAVTTICVGAGSAVISHEAAKDFAYDLPYASFVDLDNNTLNLPSGAIMTIPDTPVSTPKPVSTPIPEPYQHVQEFIGTDDAYLEEIDEDFVCALDALAQAMMEYEAALEYSMTDEQYAYIEQIMYAYYMEMESYLLQGEQFTQIGDMDVSGAFMDDYMPQYINYLYREADVISEFARIYSKEEVKDALANHTASELEEMLSMGGGAGDLIIYEISEETAQRLYDNTQELFSLLDDMNTWATELMSDPELSGYFR